MHRKKIDKIRSLVDACTECEFVVSPNFYDANYADLAEVYNGCGPDWMSEKLREKLTDYYSFFEPAFLEHDFSFSISDKTEKSFHQSNKRLLINCKKLTSKKYSWFKNPVMKYRRYRQSYTLYYACEAMAWEAWIA